PVLQSPLFRSLPQPGFLPLAVLFLYTKCGEQFLHVRRKGTVKRQTTFRYGVDEAEVCGVQRLAFEVQLIEQISVNAFSAAVDRVADQRMSDRRHVDPDLVSPAG